MWLKMVLCGLMWSKVVFKFKSSFVGVKSKTLTQIHGVRHCISIDDFMMISYDKYLVHILN